MYQSTFSSDLLLVPAKKVHLALSSLHANGFQVRATWTWAVPAQRGTAATHSSALPSQA
jgi:hypothetical protein